MHALWPARLAARATQRNVWCARLVGLVVVAVCAVPWMLAPAAFASGAAPTPVVPPIGAQLNTVADDHGTITLDGSPIAGTTEDCDPGALGDGCRYRASYAVFNRQTLQLMTSGNMVADPAGARQLADIAAEYNKAPTYLMVVNMQGVYNGDLADARRLFDTLGVAKLSDSDLRLTLAGDPVSIVGVPGSPPGSAFISRHFFDCPCNAARHLGNMAGYLRFNPGSAAGGYFEFVFTDEVEFDTDISPVRSEITMKVGDHTYAHTVPDGTSGFFLLVLDSQTLQLKKDYFYFTNNAGGQDPAEADRMAKDLASASSATRAGNASIGQVLVMLQAFGTPKGTSTGWLDAAHAIAKLGGNAQVFAQLNQGAVDEPHQGRYAFVGRSAMDTVAAESSQSLTGRADDGVLDGLIARGRDDQYEPLAAAPTGGVNFDLVSIVNRPSVPDGGFPNFVGGQAAAADFLGRDPNAIGVCDPDVAICDVRAEYYLDYRADWVTILNQLNNASVCPAAGGTDAAGTAFTYDDCNQMREEFHTEIADRNKVQTYFGPSGLQAPFIGGTGVAAIVDITKISNDIKVAVKPPETDNAVSETLGLMSNIAKLASFSALVCKPCGPVAGGLTGALAIGAYATKHNGGADLIGPEVTAKAADLGVNLYDRYQAASSNFTSEARIIMSDWSKLQQVAAAVNTTKWRLGYDEASDAAIRLATQQAIYQALVPVAYPILYDLGTGIAHASHWKCISPGVLFDKSLFQKSGIATEVPWKMTDPPYVGQDHMIVVGKRNAEGNGHGAYIGAPPDTLTGPLFRDPQSPTAGGLGFYKLAFYSPQYFHVFPSVFQQTEDDDGYGYYKCQTLPDPPGNSG